MRAAAMTEGEAAPREWRWIEPATAILLSVAGLATAWATYQSALWGGEQANHYAEGAAMLTDATRLELRVGQISGIDYLMFQGWMQAASRGERGIMTFYERRFRPEFAAAFAKWRVQYPGDIRGWEPGPDAEMPRQPQVEYSEQATADRLREQANAAYEAGDAANAIGDRFVAATVIFSTVLFLAGLASILKRQDMRGAIIILAGILGLGALVFMATLPSASL